MLRYIAARLFSTVFVIFGIVTITFAILHVVPADPARISAGLSATPEQLEKLRAEMGLKDPLYIQYIRYVKRLAVGDLGTSMLSHRRVIDDLLLYFPATLELVVAATLTFLAVGVPIGILCAMYPRRRWLTIPAEITAIAGMGIPLFWLALLLQMVFYGKLGILPATGRLDAFITPPHQLTGFYVIDSLLAGNWVALRSSAAHLVLPTISLAANRLGITARFVRNELAKTLSADYVRTAAAKGLSTRTIVVKHALRNALIPVVTMTGLQFGWLLGGTLLVEVVFGWPGLGRYAYDSIAAFDFSAVTGVVLVLTLAFALINLCTDLIYVLLDPRIEYT